LAEPAFEHRRRSSALADGIEEVPAPLMRWLQAIPAGLSRRARNAMAAGLVVSWYLGTDRLDRAGDAFLRNQANVAEAQTLARLLGIAEALFVLRGEAGFGELCSHLGGKSLQAAFFELSTARRLAEAGFAIAACDDSGRVTAVRDGETIELIQACFEDKRFSAATVRSQLKQADERLSGAHPAFVSCHYPAGWALDRWDIDFDLGSIGTEFLAATDTVNVIGFYREEFFETEAGMAHSLEGFTEANRSPRHSGTPLEEMLRGHPGSAEEAPGEEPSSLPGASAFLQWLDRALGQRP
jgi:hypothetical protein